ncbi:MAG: DUF4382 domain-containing protein [Dehalococcoidales bacterium]|nr:DUF4382 domain-containing protein [Dehalococcoidales bacterium]
MAKDIDLILDDCIDRIVRGESLQSCLQDYPEAASELEPLLQSMLQTRLAYDFTPSASARNLAKQKLLQAIEQKREPGFLEWLLGHRLALATTAAVIAVLIIGYFGLRTVILPQTIPSEIISAPSSTGNFVFLLSDEVNAISDFENLWVTVERVALLQSGNPGKWIEFTPETHKVDMVLLPGDKTQEIWRGDIPAGNYTRVVLYVSQVEGLLKGSQSAIEIKLPSNKLQLSIGFKVSSSEITSFVYDLTVIKTGNAGNGGRYLLKPQAAESGPIYKPAAIQDKGKGAGNGRKPDIPETPPVNNSRRQ